MQGNLACVSVRFESTDDWQGATLVEDAVPAGAKTQNVPERWHVRLSVDWIEQTYLYLQPEVG